MAPTASLTYRCVAGVCAGNWNRQEKREMGFDIPHRTLVSARTSHENASPLFVPHPHLLRHTTCCPRDAIPASMTDLPWHLVAAGDAFNEGYGQRDKQRRRGALSAKGGRKDARHGQRCDDLRGLACMHTRENRREQQSAHAPVVDSVCRCYPYYTYTRSHTYTHKQLIALIN